jgi:hypothetical protein
LGAAVHRVSRLEVVRALTRKAELEGLSSKRPQVVRCAQCGELVAVSRTGPVPRFCRGGKCAQLADRAAMRRAAAAAPLRLVRLTRGAALMDGPGERRDDCRRYTDCLDTFVRKKPSASFCHCPEPCSGFVPIPRDSAIQLASLGSVSQLAELGECRRSRSGTAMEDDDG